MSLDPAILRVMQANGATVNMIIAVVEAAAAIDEERLERKRANNAERQRRYKAAHKDENNAGNALPSVTAVTCVTDLPPAPPSPKDPQTPKEPQPPHPPTRSSHARKGWPLPDGVSAEQWAAFCAQRKKPLNERAYSLLTAKLTAFARAGWPPGDLIDTAIERGWETIFAPKEHRNGQRPANDQPASPATAIAAARRNLGVDGQFGAG